MLLPWAVAQLSAFPYTVQDTDSHVQSNAHTYRCDKYSIIDCITLYVVQSSFSRISSVHGQYCLTRSRQHAMQVRKELDDLTVTQPAVSQELPDYSSTPTRPQRHYAMHVSVGLAALCTWWYYLQDVPALERKLLSVLLSPVRFAYLLGMYNKPYSDLAYAARGGLHLQF